MPVTKVVKETLEDASPATGPVVVELFTAKSCAFCPQADRMFAALAGQPGVIGVACHVDYLKDTDPLAQDFCIGRQNWYMDRLRAGPNYTPQLVVNGARDAVGYKTDKVTALVRQGRGENIEPVSVQPSGGGAAGDVFLVTLPDSAVKNGLAGWQLAVTAFRKSVADDRGGAEQVRVADNMQILPLDHMKGPAFKLTVPLSDDELGVAVLLQHEATGRIAAAGQFLKEAVKEAGPQAPAAKPSVPASPD